jgi:hypothetical protein
MDFAASILQGTDPVAPGAPAQLAALAATAAGALLAVLAAAIRIRRGRAGADPAASAPSSPSPSPPPPPDAARDASAILRLIGAALLALCALPVAAAVRQLWPHPDLGWRPIAGWAAFLLPAVAAWLALGRADRSRESRS